MTDKEVVTLKEFVEEKIKALINNFNIHLKSQETALNLQAREYERRLSELNNENARIFVAQNKSVSVERYEVELRAMNEKLDRLGEARSNAQGVSHGTSVTWALILGGLASIIAIISLAINLAG